MNASVRGLLALIFVISVSACGTTSEEFSSGAAAGGSSAGSGSAIADPLVVPERKTQAALAIIGRETEGIPLVNGGGGMALFTVPVPGSRGDADFAFQLEVCRRLTDKRDVTLPSGLKSNQRPIYWPSCLSTKKDTERVFERAQANRLKKDGLCHVLMYHYDFPRAAGVIDRLKDAGFIRSGRRGPFLVGWPNQTDGEPLFLDLSGRPHDEAMTRVDAWLSHFIRSPDEWTEGWRWNQFKAEVNLWGPELIEGAVQIALRGVLEFLSPKPAQASVRLDLPQRSDRYSQTCQVN